MKFVRSAGNQPDPTTPQGERPIRRYDVSLLKEMSRVVRRENLPTLLGKAARVLRVQARRMVAGHHRRNLRRWSELQGKFRGERAFLIGNGPSLNRTPLHLLDAEHTLCFNRFNIMFERLNWRPTMYMNVDPLVASDMADEIVEIMSQVQYTFLPDFHYDDGSDFRGQLRGAEDAYWLYHAVRGFRTDLPNYWAGGTVAFAGLQVLAFLGFDPIYLVGVDMSYRLHTTAASDGGGGIVSTRDDDPNHFDPRYFGTGRNYHQPDATVLATMDQAFMRARRHADEHDIRILNAGIGGCLEHFPRVDLRAVLAVPAAEERARIDRTVTGLTGGGSWADAVARAYALSAPEDWDPAVPLATAGETVALAVIQTALFSHVPIGPFDGRYLFIRR